jgi:hypothetical protein
MLDESRKGGLPTFHANAHLSECYDMLTFKGRLEYNWDRFSPMGLMYGQEDVDRANLLLKSYKDQQEGSATTQELWHAVKVLATCAPHGELLLPPFRACGWALGATPAVAFMVASAIRWPTSLAAIFFGQWANQTQLAACTWANRGVPDTEDAKSALSSEETLSAQRTLLRAYIAAIASSVPISFGIAVAAQRWSLLKPFARFAPFPGVAVANAVGCLMMRHGDATEGIPVSVTTSQVTHTLGMSRAAGTQALTDTAITRLIMPIGNFLIVPIIQAGLQKIRGKPSGFTATVALTGLVFSGWLPFTCSVYPAMGILPANHLEPDLNIKLKQFQKLHGLSSVSAVTYERGT